MFRVLDPICRAITAVLFVAIVGMTAIMVSLVVTRYLLSYSPSWSEEVTRYLMVWLVMLGAAVLVLFDDHIALHLLSQRLSPRLQRVQGIIIRSIIAAVAALTAWTGYDFAFSMSNVVAPGSGLTMTFPTLAVPVSMSLIAVFAALLVLRDLAALLGAPVPHIPQQAEFMDGSFRPAEDQE